MNKYIRNGDLLLLKVKKLPDSLREKKDKILLEGEQSNHFHRIHSGTVFEEMPSKDNNYLLGWLNLPKKDILTHEEHKTIELEPGFYRFHSQREYSEIDERKVQD